MIDTCDICGFHHGPNDHYCGRCNVDLKERKMPGEQKPNPEKNWSSDEREKPSSKKNPPEDEKVLHWCTIRAVCNSFDMSIPLFFNLVIMLANGKKQLGFCGCASCDRGYRELQVWIIKGTEKKNVTAQSREVVIKASYDKIEGMTSDLAEFLQIYRGKTEKIPEKNESPVRTNPQGKISIEIDSEVLESAVFNVLKSEKGQDLIRSIPRKKTKSKVIS